MNWNYCSKCGKQLVKGDEPYCLSCGWRPGATTDPDAIFESLTTDEIVGACRKKVVSIDRDIRRHESEIAELKDERKRWEKLASSVGGALHREPRAARVKAAPMRDGDRWTCSKCGWQAQGRFPGKHTQGVCAGAVNVARAAS